MSKILLSKNGIRELQKKNHEKQGRGGLFQAFGKKASVVRLLDADKEFPRCQQGRWILFCRRREPLQGLHEDQSFSVVPD